MTLRDLVVHLHGRHFDLAALGNASAVVDQGGQVHTNTSCENLVGPSVDSVVASADLLDPQFPLCLKCDDEFVGNQFGRAAGVLVYGVFVFAVNPAAEILPEIDNRESMSQVEDQVRELTLTRARLLELRSHGVRANYFGGVVPPSAEAQISERIVAALARLDDLEAQYRLHAQFLLWWKVSLDRFAAALMDSNPASDGQGIDVDDVLYGLWRKAHIVGADTANIGSDNPYWDRAEVDKLVSAWDRELESRAEQAADDPLHTVIHRYRHLPNDLEHHAPGHDSALISHCLTLFPTHHLPPPGVVLQTAPRTVTAAVSAQCPTGSFDVGPAVQYGAEPADYWAEALNDPNLADGPDLIAVIRHATRGEGVSMGPIQHALATLERTGSIDELLDTLRAHTPAPPKTTDPRNREDPSPINVNESFDDVTVAWHRDVLTDEQYARAQAAAAQSPREGG